MTTPRSVPARQAAPGSNLLLWVIGAIVSFLVLFWLITLALQLPVWPEAITKNAALFVSGAKTTLYLTLVSGVLGLVLGVLLGLGKMANTSLFVNTRGSVAYWIGSLISAICTFIVWVVRGTPLFVQLLFSYYALPELFPPFGKLLEWADTWPFLELGSAFVAAVFALALNVAAYNAEVVRGGVQGVPRGQVEAARSLGLGSLSTMTTVVLPQALRLALPALVNNIVALLKDSSLAATIAVTEILRIADQVRSSTFQPIPALLVAAAVYLALTTVLTFFTDQMERRLKIASR
ncbi:amino acid ABC transporter permease [Deinococcus fonticola]|uniref:amino acid ABC transporter permease n=1 Tax=Deinococcus fonticola TaxID=2528713 RepID=UPI0010753C68|nr:amino acid ABC transporter permease [Deinococcus fonticola]